MSAIIIPYDQLSIEALKGVIEEFVTRDGTDYGEIEVSLEIKLVPTDHLHALGEYTRFQFIHAINQQKRRAMWNNRLNFIIRQH